MPAALHPSPERGLGLEAGLAPLPLGSDIDEMLDP
jgi:hypothetical protein